MCYRCLRAEVMPGVIATLSVECQEHDGECYTLVYSDGTEVHKTVVTNGAK